MCKDKTSNERERGAASATARRFPIMPKVNKYMQHGMLAYSFFKACAGYPRREAIVHKSEC